MFISCRFYLFIFTAVFFFSLFLGYEITLIEFLYLFLFFRQIFDVLTSGIHIIVGMFWKTIFLVYNNKRYFSLGFFLSLDLVASYITWSSSLRPSLAHFFSLFRSIINKITHKAKTSPSKLAISFSFQMVVYTHMLNEISWSSCRLCIYRYFF